MATLGDIRTIATAKMQDTGYGSNTEAEYTTAINEAQRTIQELTKLLYKTSYASSVDGTQEYSKPTDYMALYPYNGDESVYYYDSDSNRKEMQYASYQYLKESYTDFLTATGTPGYFYLKESEIGFYKIPDFDGSSNIYIEHYYYPTTLSATSDISDIPDKYKYATAYLACSLISAINKIYSDVGYFDNMFNKTLHDVSIIDDINTAKGIKIGNV